MKELLKKNSTVVFLMLALIVIVVFGFWFKKPYLKDSQGNKLPIKETKPEAPKDKTETEEKENFTSQRKIQKIR